MGEVDKPGIKRVLWQTMRDDLRSIVPAFSDAELLLCPTCCRPLKYEAFSLEHILPQQALSDDPPDVRAAVSRNERSGLTLLCQTPLYVKGDLAYPQGCNSWKGKFYDPFLRQALRGEVQNFNQRHMISLLCAGYLGLVRRYGYQIALLPSGLLMRRQFFMPNDWRRDMPMRSQMVLTGDVPQEYEEGRRDYWSEPFKFEVDGDSVVTVVRSIAVALPISRDPTLPVAKMLRYTPSRFRLVPDLTSVFD